MRSVLLHAWTVRYDDDKYYLPYTHWVYLNEIVKYYDQVSLFSPVTMSLNAKDEGFICLTEFTNVVVIPLPPSTGYINSIKHFFSYLKIYRDLESFDVTYARYPVPFGWLQKFYCKNSLRIIHFVGDPMDAAENNPNFSQIKKILLTTFFKPEHAMYIWACKSAKVYTNGFHLADKLKKQGITATPLISSTLNADDFYFEENKSITYDSPKLLYIGYLRKAKGVETIIKSFRLLKEKYPKAFLTIVGSGEFEKELRGMVKDFQLSNVSFMGHVDDRIRLNEIIRTHDIFCFASLSEGSPRVILEAMANGINVVSTPVGSLPGVFTDSEDILFADFNNEEMFFEKISLLINDNKLLNSLRCNAFNKVKKYTIESFIKIIFDEE